MDCANNNGRQHLLVGSVSAVAACYCNKPRRPIIHTYGCHRDGRRYGDRQPTSSSWVSRHCRRRVLFVSVEAMRASLRNDANARSSIQVVRVHSQLVKNTLLWQKSVLINFPVLNFLPNCFGFLVVKVLSHLILILIMITSFHHHPAQHQHRGSSPFVIVIVYTWLPSSPLFIATRRTASRWGLVSLLLFVRAGSVLRRFIFSLDFFNMAACKRGGGTSVVINYTDQKRITLIKKHTVLGQDMIKRNESMLYLRYWQKRCSNSFVVYCF